MKVVKSIVVLLFVSHILYAPHLPQKVKAFLVKKFSKKRVKSKAISSRRPIKRKRFKGDKVGLESLRDSQKVQMPKKLTNKQLAYNQEHSQSMRLLYNQLKKDGYSSTILSESEKTVILIRKTSRSQEKEGLELKPSSLVEYKRIEKEFDKIKHAFIKKAQICVKDGDIDGARRLMELFTDITAERFEIIGSRGYQYTQEELAIHAAIRNA